MYHPDILWFDTPSKLPPEENRRILEAVRAADPRVVVNGRLLGNFGDYKSTADRPTYFPDTPGHWAYHCHLVYHMEAGMFRTVVVS